MSLATMPTNPLLSSTPLPVANTAATRAATPTTGTGAASAPSSTSSIGTTFLSLLVQELQNQDPTAPMDSTAMVGQMISLNQLDQLTSIDQTLTKAYPPTTSSTGTGTTTGTGTGTTTGTGTGTGYISNPIPAGLASSALGGGSFARQSPISTSVSLPAW